MQKITSSCLITWVKQSFPITFCNVEGDKLLIVGKIILQNHKIELYQRWKTIILTITININSSPLLCGCQGIQGTVCNRYNMEGSAIWLIQSQARGAEP